MEHGENFSGANLKEQIEKAIYTEELAYPIRLVDFSLRNFNFKHLGAKLHYWNIIQIHELLDDFKVFPEKLDDNIWYQYISAYLVTQTIQNCTYLAQSSLDQGEGLARFVSPLLPNPLRRLLSSRERSPEGSQGRRRRGLQ